MKSNLLAEATGSLKKHPDFPGLAESLFSLIHYRSSVQKKCAQLGEMECRLLSLLADELEAVRMNELAERLGVSESRITRLVERMVKKRPGDQTPFHPGPAKLGSRYFPAGDRCQCERFRRFQ